MKQSTIHSVPVRTRSIRGRPELTTRHQRLLTSWLRVWKVSRLARDLRVEFSPRLRRAFGRCYQSDRLIRLTPSLLGVQAYLMDEVLCHEAAHAAVYERYGENCLPHGAEWQQMMEVAGFEARVRIPVLVREGSELRHGGRGTPYFVHRCPVCRSSRKALRPTQRLRCRRCTKGGRVVAMKVVATAAAGRASTGRSRQD